MSATPPTNGTPTPPSGGTPAPGGGPSAALASIVPASLGGSPVDVQRRYLIKSAVSGAAGAAVLAAVGDGLLSAATARPLAAETTAGGAAALDAAERRLLAAALGHMRPDTRGEDMAAEALVSYADAITVGKGGRAATVARAAYLEGLAACVIASIHGHAGRWTDARKLFAAAKDAAARATGLHDVRGPGVAVLADALMGKVIVYNRPGHVATAVAMANRASTAARAPGLGMAPAGGALAPSVLARAYAMGGHYRQALAALTLAGRYLELPEYSPAPYGDDGPAAVDDGPLSLLGYNARAHSYVKAEVHGMLGNLNRCRAARTDYLAPGGASHTSVAVLGLVEARCVATALTPAAGAEAAVHVLEHLPPGVTRGTVAGRALDVLAHIKGGIAAGGLGSPAVDQLAEMTYQLTPTGAAMA